MRELSLFSGAGGGLLGTKLLGWQHCGYVEYNNYCQRVIKQRIKDGALDNAPIFGDIRTFISDGYADSYQGMVDVVTAGFPCQPFSVAGRGAAENDPRNMWPETIDVIRRVRPGFALLENVPGLLAHKYIRTIFRNLAESGYECRWRILSASEMGAPHKRDRLWIVAYSKSEQSDVAKSCSTFDYRQSKFKSRNNHKQSVSANDRRKRGERLGKEAIPGFKRLPWGENSRSIEDLKRRPDVPKPIIRGMDDGVANRVDRTTAVGNGQVPLCTAAAWLLLTEDFRVQNDG